MGQAAGDMQQPAQPLVLHLSVTTCAVLQRLRLQGTAVRPVPDQGHWVLDFGELLLSMRSLALEGHPSAHLSWVLSRPGLHILDCLLVGCRVACGCVSDSLGSGFPFRFKLSQRSARSVRVPAGSLAVGERVVQDLTIHNEGGDPADLAMDFLDPHAAFSVVNAARTLKSGSSLKLLVDFAPQVRQPGLQDGRVWEEARALLMSGALAMSGAPARCSAPPVLLQLCIGCRPPGSADLGQVTCTPADMTKSLVHC